MRNARPLNFRRHSVFNAWLPLHSLFLLLAILIAQLPSSATGDESSLQCGPASQAAPLAVSSHWWTDQVLHLGWRIQKHDQLGYYRLLDPRERLLVLGTMQECFSALQHRRRCGEIPAMPERIVLTVHGLAGRRNIMGGLGRHLTEKGGLTVVNFGYASTSGTIQDMTVALESVVQNLEGVREVDFVGHSMGNILVRHLFYRFQVHGNAPPIRFNRMVMISPPNHGAEIAETVGQGMLFQLALGEVVDQFVPSRGWRLLEQQLVTPPFEFGILAGGRGDNLGFLPRIDGDDDGLLSLRTHILEGAADYLQTGGLHQLMPRYKSVRDATLNFLQSGHFNLPHRSQALFW